MKNNIDRDSICLDNLIKNYSKIVKNELERCQICSHIIDYRKYSKAKWFIVSGSDQKELNEVLKKRNLAKHFDGGIYGSPLSKDEIFRIIFKDKIIKRSESIYIGDSKYDYISAKKIGIDFVFISKWSEFKTLKSFAEENGIDYYEEFADLI